ncbi:MAG: chemotaxis protein, partial [Gammaproteobacteria bacterium]|nr:chemotaxis protein [Gammaproteobacteria bacterium]
MNIKQKLTWAFAVIACVPILLVAVVVIYNLRAQAEADFVDGSAREIRQVDNAMSMFFKGISENVEYLAGLPQVVAAPS